MTFVICKVLERIIRKQVFSFLDQNSCLNSTQHGFRPGRSCLSALLDVFDNIMHMYPGWQGRSEMFLKCLASCDLNLSTEQEDIIRICLGKIN